MNTDAIVTEAVGYVIYHYPEVVDYYILLDLGEQQRGNVVPRIEEQGYKLYEGEWTNEIIAEIKSDILPFISAPTAETDRIVLEWVQGQEDNLFTVNKFYTALGEILAVANGRLAGIVYTGLGAMNNYTPGMFAKALLIINSNKKL